MRDRILVAANSSKLPDVLAHQPEPEHRSGMENFGTRQGMVKFLLKVLRQTRYASMEIYRVPQADYESVKLLSVRKDFMIL